jgi:CBS domain-containing protein
MNVAAILKAKGRAVATCLPTTTLQDVARMLAEKRIGAVVVVDEKGDVAGILSERDMVRAIAARGAQCLPETASEIMTKGVITCTPDDVLGHIMSTMTTGRFRHVPVVEGGKLVGIVSIGDAVKHHIAEVELEASSLKSYVLAG